MGVWCQQVVASHDHSFFVDSHNGVWGYGHNLYQQLSLSAPHTTTSAVKFPCKVDAGNDRVSAHLVCTMHCGKRVGIAYATHIGSPCECTEQCMGDRVRMCAQNFNVRTPHADGDRDWHSVVHGRG